ncbi:hypothetical protein DLR11_08060 [Salmonella enterica subsp. salamae]|uniref:IS66 family insertion sequence element accessory protein TnpB n=2 Tax=Salmonella enterica TaxID=28901 RepID=A0A5Y3USQ9_SALER|nr:IS66 family insertion sequence element accessory protein TnpB [Salmonella enterica]ECC1479334.1 IS66 family insertion sequence element accessory protein TnpB [Salmonella enterica subsp. salamae]EHM1751404.1 IS66 family insertion sequence element accessory protein TnpB [Salmonella enterica subsp. salamae serovar 40:c:e,n,x,z15]HCM1998571.1 IS66 family insertion sequence element accessory protein TnpB [Salmonella enterica subsp. salamae serovar [1],40:z35:e,n,x,z15]ECC1656519.1 IS66 family ins
MIPLPTGTKIWLVAGITDVRNGFNGLAAKVQTALKDDPISGHVFIFRGRSGSQVKLLWPTQHVVCPLGAVAPLAMRMRSGLLKRALLRR